MSRILNPADRNAYIYVVGQVVDESLGRRTYKRGFDLIQLPVRTDRAGRRYLPVEFEIRDRAGHQRTVRLRLRLDEATPPLHELYRNALDDRTVPESLLDALDVQTP